MGEVVAPEIQIAQRTGYRCRETAGEISIREHSGIPDDSVTRRYRLQPLVREGSKRAGW